MAKLDDILLEFEQLNQELSSRPSFAEANTLAVPKYEYNELSPSPVELGAPKPDDYSDFFGPIRQAANEGSSRIGNMNGDFLSKGAAIGSEIVHNVANPIEALGLKSSGERKVLNFGVEALNWQTNPLQWYVGVRDLLGVPDEKARDFLDKNKGITEREMATFISGFSGKLIDPAKPDAGEMTTSEKVADFFIGGGAMLLGIGKIQKGLEGFKTYRGAMQWIAEYPHLWNFAKKGISAMPSLMMYGQLDPKLEYDMGQRIKRLATDSVLGFFLGSAGGIESGLKNQVVRHIFGSSSEFTAGYALAKLDGASNTDAAISGLGFAVMGRTLNVLSGRNVDAEISKAARDVLKNPEAKPEAKEFAEKFVKPEAEVKTPAADLEARKSEIVEILKGERVGGKRTGDPLVAREVGKIDTADITPEEFSAKVSEIVPENLRTEIRDYLEVPKQAGSKKIPAELMNSEKGAEMYTELDSAKAGERLYTENNSQPGDTVQVAGIKSSFPKWVPEDLRSTKLFKEVKDAMIRDEYPKSAPAKRLYDAVNKELHSRSGVDFKEEAPAGGVDAYIENSLVIDEAYEAVKQDGGITVDLDGIQQREGYAYSPYKNLEAVYGKDAFTRDTFNEYVKNNFDKLSEDGNYISGRIEGDQIYLNVYKVGEPSQQTMKAAEASGQSEVLDLKEFKTINTKLYGKEADVSNLSEGKVTGPDSGRGLAGDAKIQTENGGSGKQPASEEPGLVGEEGAAKKPVGKYVENINVGEYGINLTENQKGIASDIIGRAKLERVKITDKEVADEVAKMAENYEPINTDAPTLDMTREKAAEIGYLKLRENKAFEAMEQLILDGAPKEQIEKSELELKLMIEKHSAEAQSAGTVLRAFRAVVGEKSAKKIIVEELARMNNALALEVIQGANKLDWGNRNEIIRFFRKYKPATFREKYDTFRYSNMLSSLKSHLLNVFYGTYQLGVKRNLNLLTIDPLGIPAYSRGVVSSFGNAMNAFAKSLNSLDNTVKGEQVFKKSDDLHIPASVGWDRYAMPSRMMEAMDKFIGELIMGGEKSRLMSNGVAKKEAEKQAYRLYEKMLGRGDLRGDTAYQGKIAQAIDRVGKLVESIDHNKINVPLVRSIIPFIRTSLNIAKDYVETTPLGFLEAAAAKDPVAKREILASAITGTVTAIIGLAAKTTWTPPEDEDTKAVFYGNDGKGHTAKSINIFGTDVPFSYFGSQALALSMAAAIKYYGAFGFEGSAPNSKVDSEIAKATKAMLVMTLSIADMTPFGPAADFFAIFSGNEDSMLKKGAKSVAQISTQVIPYSGMQRFVANVFDPKIRKANGFIEQIEKNLPYLSQFVQPYLDLKGEPSINAWWNRILPKNISRTDDDLDAWLEYLTNKTQDKRVKNKVKSDVKSEKQIDEFKDKNYMK